MSYPQSNPSQKSATPFMTMSMQASFVTKQVEQGSYELNARARRTGLPTDKSIIVAQKGSG